jgi:hypothetical protein
MTKVKGGIAGTGTQFLRAFEFSIIKREALQKSLRGFFHTYQMRLIIQNNTKHIDLMTVLLTVSLEIEKQESAYNSGFKAQFDGW